MRATKIEIRTAALRAGRTVNGVWEPAGQLIATLWVREPQEALARAIAAAITRLDDEDVVATVEGREEIPAE
jgi:hypothetical protein